MFRILKSKQDNVLAAEISGGYTLEDFEDFKDIFEQKLNQGIQRVNLLIKIDKLDLSDMTWKAFFADSMYSLRHMDNLGHLAIVGHSNLSKVMITLDGAIFNRAKKGLEEKYFDISDLNKAWKFVYQEQPVHKI